MDHIYVKFFDNENNVVLLKVSSEDPVPPIGFKPAESYSDARKRNYTGRGAKRFLGSVLFR